MKRTLERINRLRDQQEDLRPLDSVSKLNEYADLEDKIREIKFSSGWVHKHIPGTGRSAAPKKGNP